MSPKLALKISMALTILGFTALFAGSFFLRDYELAKPAFLVCLGGVLSMLSAVPFFSYFAYKVKL